MGNSTGRCVGADSDDPEGEWNAQYRRNSVRDESLAQSHGDPRFASGVMVQRSSDMKILHVNQYELVRQLGKGAFGDVFLGKAGGESYAIKVLKKSALLRRRQGKFGSALDAVKSEIALMKKIQHPNCVGMVEVIDDPAADEVFIVLDFVDGGSSQPIGRNGSLPVLKESLIWSYTRHLLLGLEYLHMNAIVHRDLKPDNLLVSRKERGMLKIADFGTALFVETSEGNRTAGTPAFFSPELCAAGAASLVDGRASDMWAVGVTLYMWAYGRAPFMAATPMLVMELIQNCEPRIEPPPDRRVSAGLRAVISALLTRDASARMTLNQLRRHPWLSKEGRAPLIEQPGGFVQVSSADVAQAITQPMQVSGHAGALEREGSTSIVKHSIHAEYSFYVKVAASEIAAYVPILYGLKQERAPRASRRSSILSAGGEGGGDDSPLQLWMSRRGSVDADAQRAQPGDECQFVMQDLTAGMRFPCVMDIKMGTHTTLQLDESDRTPRADLLKKMDKIDVHAASADERRAGGVSKARYLAYRDSVTSTSSLGFRIDAAVTSKAGTPRGEPLEHVRFSDLKNEVAIRAALAQFLGKSKVLTKALLIKLQRMRTALDRSDFFARHVFVRSSILVTYDELAHTRLRESGGSTAEELLSLTSPAALEVKMIDFAHVHAVPNGGKLTHRAAHRANASEDGYLTGLDSLIATLERVLAEL